MDIDTLRLVSSFAFELRHEEAAERYWVILISNAKPGERHIVGYAEPVGEAWAAHYTAVHQPGRRPDELRADILSATLYLSHRFLGATMDSSNRPADWSERTEQPPGAP